MIDWRHWHNEPYLVGGLILLGWIYALLAGPFRARLAGDVPYPRAQAIKFYAALVIFYLAVGSPLDQIGERLLFSAHMLQHQLLVYPAAILFLLGLPAWMVDALLARPALRLPGRLLTHPIICALIYAIVISGWHAPMFYDWALQDKFVHVLEHVTFFLAALFFWWPLLSPSRVFPPRSYPVQMVYALASVIAMTPVSAYIVFTSYVLYPTYEFAPRVLPNFSPVDDQLLAGSMMKVGGLAVSLAMFTWSFYRWVKSDRNPTRATRRPA